MKGCLADFSKQAILAILSTAVLLAIAGVAHAELVGHWTLDNDTTGLANLGSDGPTSDLAVMGANFPTYSATGGFDGGGYATFDGEFTPSGLVSAAPGNAAADLAAGTGYPFSYSAWFRVPVPAPTGTPRGTIFALSNSVASDQYVQMGIGYNENGDLEVNRRNTTFQGEDAVGSAALVADGAWHHLAAVMSTDSTLEIYLDGALQPLDETPLVAVTFPTAMDAINIGAFRRSSTLVQDAFRGDLDDPRLYNTALTAQEIADLAGVPTVVPGDFDGDGDVDGADFVVWQTNFPKAEGGTLDTGDADGDGDVDGADFVIWQTNFPFTPSPGVATVPEPAAIMSAILGMAGIALAGWRKERRET